MKRLLLVALFLLPGACVGKESLSMRCPCASGYECCPAENTCQLAGTCQPVVDASRADLGLLEIAGPVSSPDAMPSITEVNAQRYESASVFVEVALDISYEVQSEVVLDSLLEVIGETGEIFDESPPIEYPVTPDMAVDLGPWEMPPQSITVFAAEKSTGQLYRLDGTWTKVQGQAQAISGVRSSDLWMVDLAGVPNQLVLGQWVPRPLPESLLAVDIGGYAGRAIVTTSDTSMYVWNNGWVSQQGLGVRVDMEENGDTVPAGRLTINTMGTVWEDSRTVGWVAWNGIVGQDVGVGNDVVYATDVDNRIYQWGGHAWDLIAGSATRIDVDLFGRAWAIDPAGRVMERAPDGTWIVHDGIVAQDLTAVLR